MTPVEPGVLASREAVPPRVDSAASAGRTPDRDDLLSLAIRHGLTEEEFDAILRILGRLPSLPEVGVFSAMWSEHCGYKNSRPLLKTLPTTGDLVVEGPGENAGVIDAGDGWGVAFKIESHNHPSAVEPYQGAATGVGGILRDVFTMGARPIAVLNSLRFGSLDSARSRYLLDGVVRGIGDYGNCVGIPTVGGETIFDPAYEHNPLVNAMCIGIVRLDSLARGRADGVGNPVMAVGARTGRDGIHGATFASAELDESSHESRPQVQVGDPFTEKLLLEASLELIQRDLLVGIQDMGAAGLTCSTFEMAGRGETGIDLDLDAVPCREAGMIPYELMLSESQERMLMVGKRGRETALQEVFKKYDLHAVVVGRVTDHGRVRIRHRGKVVVDLPVRPLSEDAPCYRRSSREPDYFRETSGWKPDGLPDLDDPSKILRDLLGSPSIASKRWVSQQYDSTVRGNTVRGPGSDAAVLRIPGSRAGLALTTDGNSRHCYLDPFRGAAAAVAEAARNLSCLGAEPIALTDGLNFGNPERPETMWQFEKTIEGIREASLALGVPVVSGNVSFYNETDRKSIYPTPIIGMIGWMPDCSRAGRAVFQAEGEQIVLLGAIRGSLAGSEYLARIHGIERGRPEPIDFRLEQSVQATCRQGIREGWIRTAHDCSDGGLLVALAEACFADSANFGAEIRIPEDGRLDAQLFGESSSRILVVLAEKDLSRLELTARQNRTPLMPIGMTRGRGTLKVMVGGERVLEQEIEPLREAWENGLCRAVFGPDAAQPGGDK